MKLKGSIKTGVTCHSMLKVSQQSHDEATQVHVMYQSTHVGHKCEVGRLPKKVGIGLLVCYMKAFLLLMY